MTTNTALSGSVLYETESAFCETSAFSSPTRLQVVGGMDISGLVQPKLNIDPMVQYVNEGVHDVRGVYGGSFTIELMLTGATSDTSGAVTASDLATLLGECVGNAALSAAAGTAENGGASTANAITVDASGTFSDGALCKVGALADSGGDGQFAAIDNHTTTTITLLTDLPAAPGDNDVVYAPELVYPDEDPTNLAAITSSRWRLLTDNKQYECRGCWCTAISITGLSPGELPRVSLTFNVAYFAPINITFPDATATSAASPLPCSAGSLFLQNHGTTTRATYSARSFALNIDLQTVPLVGVDSNYARQSIIGARRIGTKATLDLVLDAEAAGTQTWEDLWDTDAATVNYKHLLYTANSDLAFYFPKCKQVGDRPTQQNVDNLNRVPLRFEALTSADTTSALTLASWVIGMA